MKEFKVLPTNKDFMNLSEEQIEFIAYSMERDNEELKRAQKGLTGDGSDYHDTDSSWWEADHDEFTALRNDHDEEDIAKQVQSMTTEEDMKKLRSRWDASIEASEIVASGGTTIEQDTIENFMEANIQRVVDEAKNLERQGINRWGDKTDIETSEEQHIEELGYENLTSEGIEEAISIFNGGNSTDNSDEEEFFI